MTGRRELGRVVLAFGGVVAFFALYFSPALLGGKILAPGDGFLQNYPSFHDSASLWNPDLFSGFPAFADPQAARWYLPRLLFRAAGSFNAFTVSAYVLAGFFSFLLGRRLTGSATAGLLSGLVYASGGFFVSHLGHGNMIHAAAWLPLLLLSIHELGERPSVPWFLAGSGAVACSVMAGHPQAFVLSLLVAGAYALFHAVASRSPLLLATAGGTVAAGLALSAVAIVPMEELSSLSTRANLPFQEFVSFSLPFDQLPSILFPALFGGLPGSVYPLTYLGKWNLAEVTTWVGVTTFLLAFLAVILPGRRKEALFWTAIGAASLAFALGLDGPAAPFLYGIPVLNKFRAQGRHALELTMAASVLAAYGLAALERLDRRRRVGAVLLGAALTGALLAGTLWWTKSHALLETMAAKVPGAPVVSLSLAHNPAVALPVVLFVVTALALLLRAAFPSRVTSALLVAAFAAELAQFGWTFEWRSGSPRRDEVRRPAALDRWAEELPRTHERLLPMAGTDQEGGPIPNLSSLWGIPSASGYNPLLLKRYREFLGMEYWGAVTAESLAPANRAFDLLAIRWAFVPGSLRASVETERSLAVVPLGRSDGMKWASAGLGIDLGPGCNPAHPLRVRLECGGTAADEIGVVSSLGCAAAVPDGAEMVRITAVRTDGGKELLSLRAGADTSEWCWERADVKRKVRHSLARSFTSSPDKDDAGAAFVSHTYQTTLRLPRSGPLSRLEMEWTGPGGSILVDKVSLRDSASGAVAAALRPAAPEGAGRWKPAGESAGNAVYENTRALPRAWLVHQIAAATDEEVLRAVKEGRLPDGGPFDPSRLALVDAPLDAPCGPPDPAASAEVRSLGGDEVEVATRSATPALLDLADVHYPGWEASVDGRPVPVVRADYLLRAAPVPAGSHVVRFAFRPRSLRSGAAISAGALLLLAGVAGGSAVRRRNAAP